MKEKVGVAIVTCNRPDFLRGLLNSLIPCYDTMDELVIINDGSPVTDLNLTKGEWLDNPENLGVGKSKNRGMQYLLDKECDYIFVIEDDVMIKDKLIFDRYIQASKVTGIQHFNFGPGTPFNRRQVIDNFDLHNRHMLDNNSIPNPKITIEYSGDVKIDLYEHVAGIFSFFTKQILSKTGLNDESFYNAWEHVDLTYRIIKENGHPPFWWFADIKDSYLYLENFSDSIEKSTTSQNQDKWFENIRKGRDIYQSKHGFYPNMTPLSSKEATIAQLKLINKKWKI